MSLPTTTAPQFHRNGGANDAALNGPAHHDGEEAKGLSWSAVDLAEALNGEGQPPPSILARQDGPRLLYAGRAHQISGEPEAGKGWFALKATADLLAAGQTVVYVDFEASAPELVERLTALGVARDAITERLTYFAPHEPLADSCRGSLDAALACAPALVVLDGVTEALTLHHLNLADNADIAKWLELLPRPATRTGAAVLMIDHVVKDREQRGRYAIGAQHKLAGIDVAYSLHVAEPFGRGREGKVKIKVRKDRPGHVRMHAAGGGDVATMHLLSDEETGSVEVVLEPPAVENRDSPPTALMEQLSVAIEQKPGMVKREIRGAVSGRSDVKDIALGLLVSEGYVQVEPDGRAHRHRSVRPYRAGGSGA